MGKIEGLFDVRSIDGEPVNVNPLTVIPESEMKLYTVHGTLGGDYFESEDKFNNYINNNDYNAFDVGTVEYIRECAGKKDVLKFTSTSNGIVRLFCACDEYGYGIYNNKRSIYRGEFVWEYNYGSLNSAYKAFRDRGIVFEDDIYLEIDKRNKQLYKRLGNYMK